MISGPLPPRHVDMDTPDDRPDAWEALDPTAAAAAEAELRREVHPGHPLYGREVKAVARSGAADDVLYRLTGEPLRVAEVHLTWRAETDGVHPTTTFYESFDEWRASN